MGQVYRVKNTKINEEMALKLLRPEVAAQVCEGLFEAHELGVVHRDLKPQNIMIDDKGRAKIMDFGIARSVEAQGVTMTGVIIGTPDYISPEQADGKEAGPRSDIYSLGVILYEMMTGQVPFAGDTALSVALKHKSQYPLDPRKLNPEIRDDLSRLILVCMEKDSSRRYPSASALLNDLRNIEEGYPLGTKIRPRRESFVPASIRKKLFISGVAVIISLLSVLLWRLMPQKGTAVPESPNEPRLAVLYFKNNTGIQDFDIWQEGLSSSVITDLSQSKHIRVLPSDRIYSILKKFDLLEARSYATEDLNRVAEEGEANYILQGSLSKAGQTFRIEYTLKNIKTGEIEGSNRFQGKGEASFFTMVDQLSRSLKSILVFLAKTSHPISTARWEKYPPARQKPINITSRGDASTMRLGLPKASR